MGPNLIFGNGNEQKRDTGLIGPNKTLLPEHQHWNLPKKGLMQDALPDYRLEITLGPMLPSRSSRIRQEKNCKHIINKGMLNHVPRRTHCFVVQETNTLSRVFMVFHGFSIDFPWFCQFIRPFNVGFSWLFRFLVSSHSVKWPGNGPSWAGPRNSEILFEPLLGTPAGRIPNKNMEVLYHIRPYFGGIFPYIGLIYGRYLQFRFLEWPLIQHHVVVYGY